MNKIAQYIFVFVALLLVGSGCYEDFSDTGVCEPRLEDVNVILDSLQAIADKDDSFNKFFEASYGELIKRSPEWAAELGIEAELGIKEAYLDDLSEEYQLQTLDLVLGILKILKGYDKTLFDPDTLITFKSYEWYLDDWAKERDFIHHYYPLTQLGGPQFGLFSFFSSYQPVEDLETAEDYVARLERVDDKLACLRENIEKSRDGGLLPPKFMIDYNIDALKGIVPGVEKELSFYKSFVKKLDATQISDTDKERLLSKALRATKADVIPAYRSLVKLLKEVIADAPEQAGVGLMPRGDEFYAHILAHHTTTDMTADEIHELGLSEMKRIRAEMNVYFKELGYPDGTMTELYTRVAKKGGYIPKDKVISTYENIIDGAMDRLKQAFDSDLTPQTKVIVVGGDTAGYYVLGSLEDSIPGEFHAPFYGDMPWYPMPTLTYHEAVPGHHYQISIAQEQGLPEFRVSGSTAYVEGWALYAERLAKDIGWYDDDIYADLGRLQDEMLRAVRLVVDTGLHAMGWTREEAVAYLMENTGDDAAFASEQIDRYAAWPGQATSYKIGMIEILSLRDKASKALGKDFDLKAFHRAVLLAGSVPISTLKMVVDEYISSKGESPFEPGVRLLRFSKGSPVGFALPRPERFLTVP